MIKGNIYLWYALGDDGYVIVESSPEIKENWVRDRFPFYEIYELTIEAIPVHLLPYLFYNGYTEQNDRLMASLKIARLYLKLVDHGPKEKQNEH